MNRYTIYCTEAQTKKALELGAPLQEHPFEASIIRANEKMFVGLTCIDERYYVTPTTEQMIGWLMSKNIHIVIHKDVVDKWSAYGHEIEPFEFTVFDRLIGFKSYEEAILTAIDAALEYIENNKK